MVLSAAEQFVQRSSSLVQRLQTSHVLPVSEVLSLALFVQTWGAYSAGAPPSNATAANSARTYDSAVRASPESVVVWHQQWFDCFQNARTMSSKPPISTSMSEVEGLALLMLASLHHRTLGSSQASDLLQSSAHAQYFEDVVRVLSEYFLHVVNGDAMHESLDAASGPHHAPSGSGDSLDRRVVGYRMVCCLCILWSLLRPTSSASHGATAEHHRPLATSSSFARRRYEKLFNHRSMPMYTRMLMAFLRQEPVVPVRGEAQSPTIGDAGHVRHTDAAVPSAMELSMLDRRLDVLQCFGTTSMLAASLLAELCGLGYGEEVVAAVQRDVVSRRTLADGFDDLVRINATLHEASQRVPSQRAPMELLCAAAGILLQHTAVAIDLASSMCAATEVAVLNDFLSTVDVVCSSVYAQAASEKATTQATSEGGTGCREMCYRLLQTAHWCSSYLTMSDEPRSDHADIVQWLQDLAGRACAAPNGRPTIDCDVSGIAETQDSQATQDGNQNTRPSTLRPRNTAVPMPRPGSTADQDANPLRSGAAALRQVAETMAAAAEEQERLGEMVYQLRQKDASNRHRQEEQDAELSALKDALAQARHDLMEESSSNAAHVSQLTMNLRQQHETITSQENRIRTLERQLKRFEQMSAVIRSMTTELAQPSSFDGDK